MGSPDEHKRDPRRLSTPQLAVFGPMTVLMAAVGIRLLEAHAAQGENRDLVRGIAVLALTAVVLTIVVVELIRRIVALVRRRRDGG